MLPDCPPMPVLSYSEIKEAYEIVRDKGIGVMTLGDLQHEARFVHSA